MYIWYNLVKFIIGYIFFYIRGSEEVWSLSMEDIK
jgi:hypothetical protein